MEKMKAKSDYKSTLNYQQQQIDLKNMTKEQRKMEELRFSHHLKTAVQEGDMKEKEKEVSQRFQKLSYAEELKRQMEGDKDKKAKMWNEMTD